MERVNALPPQRKVFREEIRSAIREAIFAGELHPGDKIIETFWARELGVSQGPVREAIRDLEAQGLVETVPFKGSRVRTLTEKDIRDNYSVRICLESKSIRDAIGELSDGDLEKLTDRLREILGEMDGCARQTYERSPSGTRIFIGPSSTPRETKCCCACGSSVTCATGSASPL